MVYSRKHKRKSGRSITPEQARDVLLEDIYSSVKVIGEQVSDLMHLKPMVESLVDDMQIVKSDIDLIKGNLKRKVDLEDFEQLEKRVSRLESRRGQVIR